jgi:AcrR family transcriptional regulator
MPPVTPTTPRRTQKDRRATTRAALLEATLTCLGHKGYAGTSIGEVVTMSGLSRGAVAHHFRNKLDLVAEAIAYFYEQRFERLRDKLITEPHGDLDLAQRLAIFRDDIETWGPIGFEILVATRTDAELYAEYHRRVEPSLAEMIATYERMFPEFGALRSPELMIGVVGAFLRGLSLEMRDTTRERRDALFDLFVRMVTATLAAEKL